MSVAREKQHNVNLTRDQQKPSIPETVPKVSANKKSTALIHPTSCGNEYRITGSRPQDDETISAESERKSVSRYPGYNVAKRQSQNFPMANNRKDLNTVLLDHRLINGTHILMYIANITKLEVGAIVNEANSRLSNGTGIALEISKAAGESFQEDSNKYILKNKAVPVCGIALLFSHLLPCKYVINAVGPIWDQYPNKKDYRSTLMWTFFNSFKCADEQCRIASVAVPPIGSGIYLVILP